MWTIDVNAWVFKVCGVAHLSFATKHAVSSQPKIFEASK